MRDGSGLVGTTDGMAADTFGCVAAGSIRPGAGLCGFPAAGCLGVEDMSTSPDPGVRVC
jgi:hypothetical protein